MCAAESEIPEELSHSDVKDRTLPEGKGSENGCWNFGTRVLWARCSYFYFLSRDMSHQMTAKINVTHTGGHLLCRFSPSSLGLYIRRGAGRWRASWKRRQIAMEIGSLPPAHAHSQACFDNILKFLFHYSANNFSAPQWDSG